MLSCPSFCSPHQRFCTTVRSNSAQNQCKEALTGIKKGIGFGGTSQKLSEVPSLLVKFFSESQDNLLEPECVKSLLRATTSLLKESHKTQKSSIISQVKVPQKITVVGDLHGQFKDLHHIFSENGCPSKKNLYLFNGDFVNRGKRSCEIVLSLFAFKCAMPETIFLARGTHESTGMTKPYGFLEEVVSKYSTELYDLFHVAFEELPIVHILDKKIFTTHGGLPHLDISMQEIKNLKSTDEIIGELLWNDPSPKEGVHRNSKRSSDWMFGPDVTDRFLKTNNFDMVIRSRSIVKNGYEIVHNGKLATVFSASNYCDVFKNDGAYAIFTKLGDKGFKKDFIRYNTSLLEK